MIKLQYAIAQAIEKSSNTLIPPNTQQINTEIERRVRPSLFANESRLDSRQLGIVTWTTYDMRRKSLKDFLEKEIRFKVDQDTEQTGPDTVTYYREH